MSETKSVQVVAALIRREDGRILICQRPRQKARGLLWEFPGGKVEPGETEAQALIRECREELGILIQPGQAAARVEHAYPDLFVRGWPLQAIPPADAAPPAFLKRRAVFRWFRGGVIPPGGGGHPAPGWRGLPG